MAGRLRDDCLSIDFRRLPVEAGVEAHVVLENLSHARLKPAHRAFELSRH